MPEEEQTALLKTARKEGLDLRRKHREEEESVREEILNSMTKDKLEALERLYRYTGLIFLQWQKKFLTIIIQSLHFSSLKKKGMEKTCEKRRKKW